MATITQLLEKNRAIASSHQPIPKLSEYPSIGRDFAHTLVLTCCDPRCSPETFLGLKDTDGVIVIRNAGGHVTPETSSILALDHLVHLNDILVIHHTDCGTLLVTDEQIKETLKKRMPESFASAIEEMTFGTITDLEQSVLDDLAILRASPYVRKELGERCIGYVFDIATGLLTQVSPKV